MVGPIVEVVDEGVEALRRGEEAVRFRKQVCPALSFEVFLETIFGLASDGKTYGKWMPNPLRLAAIIERHFDLVRLPSPPAWMQRTGLALGAPLGRLLGYEPTYVPAYEPEPMELAA